MSEIAVIDNVLPFVREHPSFFFRDGVPTPLECVQALLAEAVSLGATDISIRHLAPWWILSSSFDWFAGHALDQLFTRLIPLPEAGVNTSRYEVVVAAFAQAASVHGASTGRAVVHGEPPPEPVWAEMTHATRALAFRF